MKSLKSFFRYHVPELIAFALILVGGFLSVLGLLQRVPLLIGLAGVLMLATALFFYCLRYTTEKAYKEYYKESYDIEHSTIEEEIRKSMTYHRYQEAMLNRYESACRDLGITKEQSDWLLMLLMDEKNQVDNDLKENGFHI
jgi:hypothetical protein